ncbi:MAG: CHAP domain-containing protein [Ktedonobacteraceae bacterium]
MFKNRKPMQFALIILSVLIICVSFLTENNLSIQTAIAGAQAKLVNNSNFLMPPQWSGKNCDTNNDPGSKALATFQGVSSCIGPSSNPDPDKQEKLGGTPLLEWECVELAMRYMLLIDNVTPYPVSGGEDVAPKYPGGHGLTIENNPASGVVPQPGDIISFGPTSKNSLGHVAIVDNNVNINPVSGTGTIEIFQQNFIANGKAYPYLTLNVSKWNITNTSPGWKSTGLGTVSKWLHSTGNPSPTPTPTPPPSSNLVVTQGVWTSSATLGGHLDAQFTVTDEGNAPFNLSQLYIGVRGPHNENVDLGGDGNNTPIQPGQSRNIYKYTDDFTSGCSTCNDGTYIVFASVQMPDGSWWNPPPANGSSNSTNVAGTSPLLITQGVWTYNPLIYGEHFDAQYTVTNESSSPFNLDQLYIGVQGPNGQNVDLGGDGNNTPLQPGQSRNIYQYTDTFASNCSSCNAGTYIVYAEIQKSDGTWWVEPPAASGQTNIVQMGMAPANIFVTQGLWVHGNTTIGGYEDAQYTVTNMGGAPFNLSQLYLAVRDPNGSNADLGGDGNSTPILPGQSRNIFKATQNFASNCPNCIKGTYTIFASIQMPDGSWWGYPPTNNATNATTFVVSRSNAIQNPGFESGSANWTLYSARVEIQSNYPHSGSYMAAINDGTGGDMISQTFASPGADTYSFCGYVAAGGNGGIMGVEVNGNVVNTLTIPNNSSYTQQCINNIQLGASDQVEVYITGAYGIWVNVDDFSFTGISYPNNAIQNPGFEEGTTGWNFVETNIEIQNNNSHSGTYEAAINDGTTDELSQTFSSPGADTYSFCGFVAASGNGGIMGVKVNGNTIQTLAIPNNSSYTLQCINGIQLGASDQVQIFITGAYGIWVNVDDFSFE